LPGTRTVEIRSITVSQVLKRATRVGGAGELVLFRPRHAPARSPDPHGGENVARFVPLDSSRSAPARGETWRARWPEGEPRAARAPAKNSGRPCPPHTEQTPLAALAETRDGPEGWTGPAAVRSVGCGGRASSRPRRRRC